MVPVVSIIGRSNVGKTTVLEGLIRELKGRGYKLAVAKHLNEDVELDQPGKDSWRLARAGADAVVISTPSKLAMVKPVPQVATLEELQYFIGSDFDLFLVDGYKKATAPKIEVRRGDAGQEALAPPEQLVAIVSEETAGEGVPRFSFSDARGLADLIEQKYLQKQGKTVAVFVNGSAVPLNPFVKEFIAGTVVGMVSALKGVKKVSKLDVRLRLTD